MNNPLYTTISTILLIVVYSYYTEYWMPVKRELSSEQKATLINHLNALHSKARHLQLQLLQKQQQSKELMKLAIPLGLDYVSIQKEIEDKKKCISDQIIDFIY